MCFDEKLPAQKLSLPVTMLTWKGSILFGSKECIYIRILYISLVWETCVFHAVYMYDLHGLILCTIYNTRNIHGKNWLKNLLTIRVSLRLFFWFEIQPNRHWQPESKFFFLGNHSGFTIQALFSRCKTPVSFVFGWVDFKRTRSRNPGEIHFFNQPEDILQGNSGTRTSILGWLSFLLGWGVPDELYSMCLGMFVTQDFDRKDQSI